nr:hypothetical protein [Tanacetum cinerariifolium]
MLARKLKLTAQCYGRAMFASNEQFLPQNPENYRLHAGRHCGRAAAVRGRRVCTGHGARGGRAGAAGRAAHPGVPLHAQRHPYRPGAA